MMKNKRGVVPIFITVIGVILALYVLLLLPIPAFTRIRAGINYYLIVALWITIQAGLVYGVYRVIKYMKDALKMYKKQLLHMDLKIKDFILTH